ncbi:MAG: ABC transporter ATP-binding protein [Thiotrichales bacterium]
MRGLQVSIARKVYRRNQVVAIDGLTFHADRGEFVAIVGPSGAGKTTLLNTVSGIDSDFDGEVLLEGEAIQHGRATTQRIGFLFQDSRLMPWLSVFDNIQLVLGRDRAAREKAAALVEQVGLTEFTAAFPGQLSGGMQRRVALARAFAVEPRLLLMDEPFQSLDAPTANFLRGLLLTLWSETQSIVLFVTHSLREALALADRVIFLSSRPARAVLDFTVALPRPRALESPSINALHDELLWRHPDLLSGCSEEESPRRAPVVLGGGRPNG